MADADQSNLTGLTVDLLSAYVANNNVQHGELSELIKSTHAALKIIDSPNDPAPVNPEHKPAVSVRKSLGSRLHIISMIDGKPYQTLKRHLSRHGLTPQEYRERYGLPRDYPMVAPAYSESRRAIAQRLGLGRKGPSTSAPVATEQPANTTATPKVTKAKRAPAMRKSTQKDKAVAAAAVKKPVKQASKPAATGKNQRSTESSPSDQPATAKAAPRKRGPAKASAA